MQEGSMILTPRSNIDDGCRWVQTDFSKVKLRARERYWHSISLKGSADNIGVYEAISCIIPDGLAWRIYLPLIEYLVELEDDHYKNFETSVQHRTTQRQRSCMWVVLESVADWMDHRSMSSISLADSNDIPPETPNPHERSKIRTLIQRYTDTVKVFCDLSVREVTESGDNEDEWYPMEYENMSMSDRSQNSLFRSGRLLRQYGTNKTKNPSRFFILSGEKNFVERFPEEDGTQTILMKDLFDIMDNKAYQDDLIHDNGGENTWLTDENLKYAKKLALQCEEDYNARNALKMKSKSLYTNPNIGFQDYWSEKRVDEGLRERNLFKGRLSVTKGHTKEAVVLKNGGAASDFPCLFVDQAKGYFNRALNEDIVIVQVLPKEMWTSPADKRRLVHLQADSNDDNDGLNIKETGASSPVPSARVIAIAKEYRRHFVATLIDFPMSDESICLVVPMDSRIPKIRIKTNTWQRLLGHRLWVQVLNWEVDSKYPVGRCINVLGPIGDLETEITCLLKENQIKFDPFSAAAQACLPLERHDWKIPFAEISRRKDLRSTRRIFSVDPTGCQDIDDTFHAHILPNGDIEVGVHIADVSFFLLHDSQLDMEAKKRATTFYLVDRRFDMLPHVLSSDLCSLHGNVDRLAVSTIWTMSGDFNTIKTFWYGRTVIRNCQAMTYDQGHNIIHNRPPDDPSRPAVPPLTAGLPVSPENISFLREDLLQLTNLARKLRKNREDAGGAVDLSSGDTGSELKFSLDKNHNPVRVTPKKQLEIHQTVAELMIMANTWVAKMIVKNFPSCALLRIHRCVDENRFEDLKEILKTGKMSFDGSSNMRLANSLKKAEKSSKTNPAVNSLFKSLATRAMSEAQYISTGLIGEEDIAHYGLGLRYYTHFTSPIRRYADVVVHRQLLLTLAVRKENIKLRPPPGFEREVLDSLPESQTLSIIRGEGITYTQAKVTPMAENTSISTRPREIGKSIRSSTIVNNDKNVKEYSNQKVTDICQILNRQNRMAKISSFECQSLFLSLYFRDHFEIARAVVTSLKSNGFWVYIPNFDFRAPVHLSDKNGEVHINPAMVKLDASSGLDPNMGLASPKGIRRFPSGTCTLVNSLDDHHLEVSLQETSEKYKVRVLDVVEVNIFCNDWNAKSRIPQPRIQLVPNLSERTLPTPKNSVEVLDERALANDKTESHGYLNTDLKESCSQMKNTLRSIYEEIENLVIPTNLSDEHRLFRRKPIEKTESIVSSKNSISGRFVFGNFVNPDTRSARKEESVKQASANALERRYQAMEGRAKQNEYDTSKRIESDVTTRIQKLAANKRNAKKGKN